MRLNDKWNFMVSIVYLEEIQQKNTYWASIVTPFQPLFYTARATFKFIQLFLIIKLNMRLFIFAYELEYISIKGINVIVRQCREKLPFLSSSALSVI